MYDSEPMKNRVTVLLAAGFLLASCGDDDGGSTEPEGGPADATEVPQSDTAAPTDTAEPSGLMPLFDLAGSSLYDAPFPTDLRRKAEGGLDMSGFPNPNQLGLVSKYLAIAETVLDGFSLTPSVTFRFEGPIDPATVSDSDASWHEGSNIILVDVDKDSFSFRRRFPLRALWWGQEESAFMPHDSLTLQPLFGTPLAAGTTYACIVLRDVKDKSGERIGQHSLVAQGLAGEGPLADLYEPLRFYLGHGGNIPAVEIAVATVFTTGTATSELRTIADYVQTEMAAPKLVEIAATTIAAGEDGGPTATYHLYEGLYESPNFQAGEKPYKSEGGDIRFDAAGKPIVQETEVLRFALVVPAEGEMPDNGWPLVLYGHGTGGDWKSFTRAQPWPPARELAKRGIAVMGIDQPLHGTRYDGSDGDSIINSFNVFNVDAARSNFRQSAIDVMVQARLARTSLAIPAGSAVGGAAVAFDPDQIYFFGHSHGALAGGLFAPFIQGVRAMVLSAAGGGLSHTVMKRKDPVDIRLLLEAALFITNPNEFSIAHPVMALMQNLVDITDPLSYAPLYINPGDEQPRNVLLTEGTTDAQTPPVGTDNLAAAAEIPILKPAAHPSEAHAVLDIQPLSKPVFENYVYKTNTATSVLVHFEGDDHYAVFDNSEAVNLYTGYIMSAIANGKPTVD